MAAKKSKRKSPPRRRKTVAQKYREAEIPLTVLKRRLAKLSRVVKTRESQRQTSLF